MNLAWRRIAPPEFKLLHTRGLAAAIVWTSAIAALGLTAYWTGKLVSPAPIAALPSQIEAPRSATAEQDMVRLFGVQAGGVETHLDGITLTGVFAPHGGSGGWATFRTTKGNVGVTVGREIAPGLRLERVEPTQVVIFSGGGERILELPKPKFDQLGGDLPAAAKPTLAPGPDPARPPATVQAPPPTRAQVRSSVEED